MDAQREDAGGAEAGGHSVAILVPDERGRLTLDEAALRSVLMQDDVRNLPVAVLAVAGAFRKGKSFLLSLLLRFLERGGAADWQGAPDEPLAGFAWRGGRQRHTVGIHIWSRPARVRLASGEQVAVVLMDTQGTFDNQTESSENATLFALSGLVSSVLVYNVSGTVGTSDLQHLQLFSEFGRLAASEGHGTAFQRLLFLVRDWQSPVQAPYGSGGGRIVLNELLDSPPDTPDELRRMREHVRRCFSDIDCFLLPHPGKEVATSPTFAGCPRDVDAEFLQCVDSLARLLLSPERLVKKESSGEPLTAAGLVSHLVTLHAALSSGELPEPRSLVNAMSEANHLASVDQCTIRYAEQMRQLCGESPDQPGVPEEQLQRHHQAVMQNVITEFDNKKKMLGDQGASYRQKMLDAVESWRSEIFRANKMKNELTEARDTLCCNKALMDARDEHQRVLNGLLNSGQNLEANQLQERHIRSRDDLLRRFDALTGDCSRRQIVSNYRAQLKTQMEHSYEEAELFSEQRRRGQTGAETDRVALGQARQRYRDIMEECLRGGPLFEDEFAVQQRTAEEEARREFAAKRDPSHSAAPRVNEFLERDIQGQSKRVSAMNLAKTAIQMLGPILMHLVRTGAFARCVVM